ncbi:BAR-domain-containing protein [Sodiomyces alkalinus F11]|uniref:BAR-domain-containing protein n=1 Tax=Sodiomyces alkalinus (strain CBS 110278 / VKM F-3762 / F11) TaxID=1314773 RepID=A0A3N2PJL3_SODAK|nr:BAR-domain-containing protein [Sodiomyces alkalinus F11]ROT34506.1 BAR-domain-containing protein [Sodiomyces alkalinus F11]
MQLTKKLDRAFQWAGEKIGGEKTGYSDEFKSLEAEMVIRQDGMEKLHKSTNGYVKWVSRRGESLEDKEKALPVGFVGRMMVAHGEDLDPNSQYGNSLIALGKANECLAEIQEAYVTEITQQWVEAIDMSLAMMKEYQVARKKHESRRLAYDTNITKLQKAKREDYRLEEEMRSSRAKFEESGEDVLRRMQDIKDAEPDNFRDLTRFLDAQLSYHERSAEALRRLRRTWPTEITSPPPTERFEQIERTERTERAEPERPARRLSVLSRARSTLSRNHPYEDPQDFEPEPQPQPVRMPFRSHHSEARFGNAPGAPDLPVRPTNNRSHTFQAASTLDRRPSAISHMPSISALRGNGAGRPLSRINTTENDIFADDYDDSSAQSTSGSPNWGGARSASPATSVGSLTRSSSNLQLVGGRKAAPPPPPPCRSKKPPPPIPPKRAATQVGY